MNEVVKYHNELNTASMRHWNQYEMDFFFSVLSKMKDRGSEIKTFNIDEFKEITKYARRGNKRWNDVVIGVSKKVVRLNYIEQTPTTFEIMNLFQSFKVDFEKRTLEVSVSRKFEYILNKLEMEFTKYPLDEFISLKSTYSKTLYRKIKQWKTIGCLKMSKDEFHQELEIPKSYRQTNVNKTVLTPIQNELSRVFDDFKIKVIKQKTRGNPVIGYEITWKAEKTSEWLEYKYQDDTNDVPTWWNETSRSADKELLEKAIAAQKKLGEE